MSIDPNEELAQSSAVDVPLDAAEWHWVQVRQPQNNTILLERRFRDAEMRDEFERAFAHNGYKTRIWSL